MKKIFTCIAMLAMAGCASYGERLEPLRGQHVSALVGAWGPPQSSYQLPDGSQVLQYARRGNMVLPGATYTVPQTSYTNGTASAYGGGGYASGNYYGTTTTYVQQKNPDLNIALSCTTNFTINPDGYITGFNWSGNNC